MLRLNFIPFVSDEYLSRMPGEVAFSDSYGEPSSPTDAMRRRYPRTHHDDIGSTGRPGPYRSTSMPEGGARDYQTQQSHESVDDFEMIQHPENLVEALRQVNNYTVCIMKYTVAKLFIF